MMIPLQPWQSILRSGVLRTSLTHVTRSGSRSAERSEHQPSEAKALEARFGGLDRVRRRHRDLAYESAPGLVGPRHPVRHRPASGYAYSLWWIAVRVLHPVAALELPSPACEYREVLVDVRGRVCEGVERPGYDRRGVGEPFEDVRDVARRRRRR